ncbi:MAG: PKD domain-containing protein [Chitinophagaceae bacterium]
MKKLVLIFLLLTSTCLYVVARHIKGGEISYLYIGPGAVTGTEKYEITLRLFLECNASGQQLDPEANIGIFRNINETPTPGSPFLFPLRSDEFINLRAPNPCISSPSPVCYRLRIYKRTIDLPIEAGGYSIVFQRCCRINGLINLSPNSNVGSSYTCRMGGSDVLGSRPNSSAAFAVKDTVLICQRRPFTLDFSAEDPDGDSLSYEFCDAYTALQGGGGGTIDPVPPSQINFVNYFAGFSGSSPLGPGVTINAVTGKIEGIAPGGGDYVISVCVREWRNNRIISEHRKDFNIKIDQQCDLAAAFLQPTYINCRNFSFAFQNESPPSSLIHSYYWDFGVPVLSNDTSSLTNPVYTYRDTGIYKVRLVINRGEQCSDSTESNVKIYPGFFPGYKITGSCVQVPYLFTDTTKANYGYVNKWIWNLGDETSADDTSTKKITNWQYKTSGLKAVALIVSSSFGCIDTVIKLLDVREKPIVDLAFRDTLICSIDTLQLKVNGPGIYTWSPQYNIINPRNASPYVFPTTTTIYHVDMNDNGCTNTDSVKVRVVDFVTLNAGTDTTICSTDTVQLKPITDGLQFTWSPASTLNNPSVKNPLAFPSATTNYRLNARIGKCNTSDYVLIKTVPYPYSFAGLDTVVCFDDTAILKGTIRGSRFTWTPSSSLSNPRSLSTFAYPLSTTTYTLSVYDTLGCPKPGNSKIRILVRAPILAFAGNDTSIVIGQPLQLKATGSSLFQWSPGTYLSNAFVQNPIALLSDNYRYTLKAFTEEGCFAMDTINIKVFKTGPDIFVPNAFSPTGRNRVLRPIPVGIATLDYFRVYNRWGQLVFQTSQTGKGWDGMIAGKLQNNGSYVWQVKGKDYTGKMISRQGTALLIR